MTITLTPRQYEVALLAAEGLSSPSIARQLCVSEQTIKNHLTRAYRSLGLRTQGGTMSKRLALRAALEAGLIRPQEGARGALHIELVYYAGVIRVDRREPRQFVRERLLRAFAEELDRRLEQVYGERERAA